MKYKVISVNEVFLETIFRNMTDAISVCPITKDGMPGKFIFLNPAGETITGYTNKELLSLSPSDIISPELIGRLPARMMEIRNKKQICFDSIIIDSKKNPVQVHISASLFENGGQSYVIFSLRDISELRKTQEALKASRTNFEALFNHIPDGVYLLDVDGNFQSVNHVAYNCLGYMQEEMLKMNVADINHQLAPDTIQNIFDRLKTQDHYTINSIHTRRDGTTFPVEITVTQINQNGKPNLLAVVRDITERKEAEAKILATKAELSVLIENMHYGFAHHRMIFDNDGNAIDYEFRLTNPAFHKITGISNILIGSTVREVFPAGENENNKWIKIYSQVVKTGVPINIEEYDAQTGRWYSITAYRPKNDHFACIFDDITERKASERMRIQAEKDATVSHLTGGVAHDFNNILSIVIGYLEMSLDDIQADTSTHSNLQDALNASRNATELIRHLMEFSTERKEMIGVDVNLAIKGLKDMLKTPLKSIDSVTWPEQKTLPQIKSEKSKFMQLVMNLIINAIHAMEFTERKELRIDTNLVNVKDVDYIVITVSDTGKGIPEEVKNTMFKPYITTKPEGKGTGLGLFVVDTTVKEHGGFIECDSEVGIGTTFKIYLPASTETVE
ncbi:MAG: hypothetical protein A2Y40_09030 [Candidatus Margulisbacteria bacterium GWF2_35_9]|nr:MAG: hypothetical protein A2Y40_09030 [Candidatus Margulisbacteria bacterium GWF2_35_9]